MKCFSLFAFALVVIGSVTRHVSASPVSHELFTEAHPINSTIALDLYLGNPSSGGIYLTTAGPTDLIGHGPMVIDIDENGDGTVNAGIFDLLMADAVQTREIGTLGTIDISFQSFHISVTTGVLPVKSNVITLDDAGAGFAMAFDGGQITLSNPTGMLATLLPGTRVYNYGNKPFSIDQFDVHNRGVLGSTDNGPELFSTESEFNIDLTGIDIFLFGFGSNGSIWGHTSGSLHLAVPEINSLGLLLPVFLVTGFVLRRKAILRQASVNPISSAING